MGVEFGSPSHGLLKFNYHVRTIGGDEFVKKIFNKQIKPNLKKLPSSGAIHSMRLALDTHRLTITLIFRQSSFYSTRNSIKKEIKDYFAENGFNPDKIIVND
jgi:hypothetical protein